MKIHLKTIEIAKTMAENLITGRNGNRMVEWEAGLPTGDDLPPLSHPLVSLDLAVAFEISQKPPFTFLDVDRATQKTISSLRASSFSCTTKTNECFNFKCFIDDHNSIRRENPLPVIDHGDLEETEKGSDAKKSRWKELDEAASAPSATAVEDCLEDQSAEAKTLKRARLLWTPQLHKRFVEVVAHLRLKNAVPKSIMQLMNVEGLTRENVASHLQKYRLHVKRMQGIPNESPTASAADKLFASLPAPPHSLNESSASGIAGGGVGGSGRGKENTHGDDGNQVETPIPMFHPPPSLQMLPIPFMGGIGFAAQER